MIRFGSNGADLESRLTDVGRKQLPFATALALTRTAKDAEAAMRDRIREKIDRPRPFTVNAPMIQPATKSRLRAVVKLRDFAGKGTAAAKYLAALDTGGPRRHKRFERALIAAGIMRPDQFAVPGASVKLDRYGNVPGSTITQMLSRLNASPDSFQNATAKSRRKHRGKRASFFIPREGDGSLPAGIWRRDGIFIEPLFIFVRAPAYRATLRFDETILRVARLRFPFHMPRAFEEAMRSRR